MRSRKADTMSTEQISFRSQAVDEVIAKLTAEGSLDDEKFARWFSETRALSRPRSRSMLQAELQQRGLNRAAMEGAVKDYNSLEACATLLLKRRRIKSESLQDLAAYLMRKGFRFSEIQEVIRRENIDIDSK